MQTAEQSREQNLKGKTCVVTGATSGIGQITAQELARKGARVVLVSRDAGRGQATAQAIAQETGNREVQVVQADLSSQAEVRRAAAEIRAACPVLDVLVNNAGAMYLRRELTVDGLERTFATNHLAYFLLTHLLLGPLKASPGGRVVNVASTVHRRGALDFDDLQGARRYSGMAAYNTSKLANVLFTFELARRLAGTKVTANCLHPGVISSGFGRNNAGIFGALVRLAGPFMLTPAKGAATTIYLASAKEVEGVTGQYFARCRQARPSPAARDQGLALRLWEVSARLTGVDLSGALA